MGRDSRVDGQRNQRQRINNADNKGGADARFAPDLDGRILFAVRHGLAPKHRRVINRQQDHVQYPGQEEGIDGLEQDRVGYQPVSEQDQPSGQSEHNQERDVAVVDLDPGGNLEFALERFQDLAVKYPEADAGAQAVDVGPDRRFSGPAGQQESEEQGNESSAADDGRPGPGFVGPGRDDVPQGKGQRHDGQ